LQFNSWRKPIYDAKHQFISQNQYFFHFGEIELVYIKPLLNTFSKALVFLQIILY